MLLLYAVRRSEESSATYALLGLVRSVKGINRLKGGLLGRNQRRLPLCVVRQLGYPSNQYQLLEEGCLAWNQTIAYP